MKKLIALSVIVLFAAFAGSAQTFEKGDMVLNAGIGIGHTYGHAGGISPSITVTAERGFWEIGDFGVISIGALLGYQYSRYHYWGYDNSWSNFYFGARGLFHFTIIPVEKLDVYAGIGAGLRIDTEPDWIYENRTTDLHFGPYGGVFAGARYYFSDNFAAFAELGYEVSWLKLGVAFKF
ncbi:MAG: hypothetical protein A2Y71_05745 [Bacteroidetes bacterium RBG_13_42_15]|nr:MAG: hypothetical protein A2Y71_05745 [Bacteroidetes bacterium RBG_13_42_15]